MYTEDRNAWLELEYSFASYMTTRNRNPEEIDDPAEEIYTEAFYEWFLDWSRSLDQEEFVALVQRYAPELLKMVVQKLEPKPVKKHAWMVVYDDESKRGLFDTESEAQGWARHAPTRSKVVKVTWEE